MRLESRYRAKAIEPLVGGNQWVEGYGVYKIELADNTEEWILSNVYQDILIDPDTIGEFTGRLNIFENDIVRGIVYHPSGEKKTMIGVVKNINYGFVVEGIDKCFGVSCALIALYDCEIIGNKSDNPDLL
jgi:hypothetical protein